ncbi:primosomal protein N' [Campylobacter sp. RM12651]|uniref:primosomal protein N' n=1 Tax=Campylobacter sp. RM12651 TaxID=1660079 RepID=UPI001EFBC02B|nr:primosomal protein N' [Campylobacter sp. RM12651]ULO03264.1 primosomal protein N' [Campylobacter sp. RM12651]
MNYYKVAILGHNLETLTYESDEEIKPFSKVEVKLHNKNCLAIVINKCEKPTFNTKQIISIFNEFLTDNQMKLAEFMSKYYAANISLCLDSFILSKNISNTKNNLNIDINLKLNEKQLLCLNSLQNNKMNLVFGDTGSGKTEIYAKLIQECLNEGKQALFLMPEISLTPQMQKRMKVYFKDLFITWHSKITKANKQKDLIEFELGNKPLVIGARSALFLPFSNLGLIIVDEEHDNSYKSSKYPCYNARDLAIYLASITNAKIILGSATPSLQSFYNQNINKFRLKGTYFQSEKEILFDDSLETPSSNLLDLLEDNLNKKEQSMIFLPVRGNYRQVVCKDCNSRKVCPNCSVAMSLHNKTYKCHYCGKKEYLKNTCDNCGSEILESKIIGTAQLCEELKKALPNANIAKLDSDELSSATKLKEILEEFELGNIDILVGTQLISKGHDYKNVTFCAILGLDEYLFYPDYKARENTLALAIQVAGRAGRSKKAKVLINTQNKDFFEKYLQNYDEFLEDEKFFRTNYPPFKRLLRLIIASKNEIEASNLCEDLANHLKNSKENDNDYEIIGYGKCAIEKINNNYRYYILLRSNKKMLLSNLALHYKQLQKVTIDIDPIHFS